jgi:hypothetical protein
MNRSESPYVLLAASALVELIVTFGLGMHSMTKSVVLPVALLIVPSSAVGYLTGKYGLIYGLILGVFPAIFALVQLPTAFFGLSPVGGALMLFVGYVLVSGLSGAGGQLLRGSIKRWFGR